MAFLALIDRVESVKKDHEETQSSNQVLQTYINNLMSSSVLSQMGTAKKDALLQKVEKVNRRRGA
jgi:hypothetical protein